MSGLSSSTHAHFAASILPWKDFENIAMSHAFYYWEAFPFSSAGSL